MKLNDDSMYEIRSLISRIAMLEDRVAMLEANGIKQPRPYYKHNYQWPETNPYTITCKDTNATTN